MTVRQLKQHYINFFYKRGHALVPSASLLPENDPSILLTTAGMHPLVPFLKGAKHPQGKRLVNFQKCLRTGDINEVGDPTHLTFFEMLGNWSLGDYWKEDAITWSFEFLTRELGIPLERLAVSVFAGDENARRDTESADIWRSVGVAEKRIAYLGAHDNWWPAGADAPGPQGPDTEMFYWIDNDSEAPAHFDAADTRWVEIWNDVFMEFERTADGSLRQLEQKNVDTGMGVERTVAALDGKRTVYEIDTIEPLVRLIKENSRTTVQNMRSAHIIADHIRAAAFLLADERQVRPSNVDQGYVLRRLIRRMVRHAKVIGFDAKKFIDIAQLVIHEYHRDYPELARNRETIMSELEKERDKFTRTLDAGLKMFEKAANSAPSDGNGRKQLSAERVFDLVTSYGLPIEDIAELVRERNFFFDRQAFDDHFRHHQNLSRTAAVGKFKGGLADHSEQTISYHTANHMMLEAMKRVLGRDEVNQKGSNITAERLRFDFTFPRKLTNEEIGRIEQIVNDEIKKNHTVEYREMSLEEAKKIGATGVFDHKYGDSVKVYFVGDFSKEICGGPHVSRTGSMGRIKIVKEEASSAGVRRVKAVFSKE